MSVSVLNIGYFLVWEFWVIFCWPICGRIGDWPSSPILSHLNPCQILVWVLSWDSLFFEMTFDPTVITSSHLMWSSTKLWARDLFIEYLHLFCQILYNFCQRLFTSTCALPSDRLNVRGLSRRFLYCFDRDLLFLSYGTSFILFPGFAIYGRVYMLVSPYFIYCYFYCRQVIHRN